MERGRARWTDPPSAILPAMGSTDFESWWRWTGRRELSRLLWERWDPVGNETGYKRPEDEYDFCVDDFAPLLCDGSTAERIASYMERVDRDLRVTPHQVRTGLAAEIIDWYARSRPRGPG
jgi:hypothetical protein